MIVGRVKQYTLHGALLLSLWEKIILMGPNMPFSTTPLKIMITIKVKNKTKKFVFLYWRLLRFTAKMKQVHAHCFTKGKFRTPIVTLFLEVIVVLTTHWFQKFLQLFNFTSLFLKSSMLLLVFIREVVDSLAQSGNKELCGKWISFHKE